MPISEQQNSRQLQCSIEWAHDNQLSFYDSKVIFSIFNSRNKMLIILLIQIIDQYKRLINLNSTIF